MSSSQLRPSQPDLPVAVPNDRAGSARRSGGGHGVCQHAVLVPPAPVPGGSGPRRSADSGGPLCGGPGARVCVCWEDGPPGGRPCASASPSPGAHGPSPSPEAARTAAEQPRLRLPRFLPPALPRPGSRGCRGAAPGGRAVQSAHGGGRRRPGSGWPRRREARAKTPAPLSAFALSLPASRTPLAPTPSRRD